MTNNIATCEDGVYQPADDGNSEQLRKLDPPPYSVPLPLPPTGDPLIFGNDDDEKSPYHNGSIQYPPPSPIKPPMDSDSANYTPASSQSSECKPTMRQITHMILVVIASSIINGVVFGVVNNFGLFYYYLVELIKAEDSVLVWAGTEDEENMASVLSSNSTKSDALRQSFIAGIGSLNIGLIFFCSIFASVLSDRYGIRQVCFIGGILSTIGMYASSVSVNIIYLYITYGLVMGIGASLVYAPSLAILGHYFTKRLGLVNGLVTAGSSSFTIVMPILLRKLIDSQGIQTTFKYLSILMATMILCSLTFKEQIQKTISANTANASGSNNEKHSTTYSSRNSLSSVFSIYALVKNRLYLFWLISIPIGLFGYFVPFYHLVKHAKVIESTYQGEILVMCIGIFSLVGRLISGPLADVSHVNRIVLQQIAFVSIGILTMTLTIVRDLSLLLICCGLGLFDGCFISLLGPIAFDLVGPEYANQAIGLLLCACSLPLTVGPPIAAYAYGIYGSYKLAFFVAGIPPILAAILMFYIIRLQRIQRSGGLGGSPLSRAELSVIRNSSFRGDNGEKIHLLFNNSHGSVTNGSSKLRLNDNSSSSLGGGAADEMNTNEDANLLKGSNGVIIVPDQHDSRLKFMNSNEYRHHSSSIRT